MTYKTYRPTCECCGEEIQDEKCIEIQANEYICESCIEDFIRRANGIDATIADIVGDLLREEMIETPEIEPDWEEAV